MRVGIQGLLLVVSRLGFRSLFRRVASSGAFQAGDCRSTSIVYGVGVHPFLVRDENFTHSLHQSGSRKSSAPQHLRPQELRGQILD